MIDDTLVEAIDTAVRDGDAGLVLRALLSSAWRRRRGDDLVDELPARATIGDFLTPVLRQMLTAALAKNAPPPPLPERQAM